MRTGYLSIETHRERPGLVRLFLTAEPPEPAPAHVAQRRIRYIARFNDREAALMHTHEILKRRLLDADTHLYRAPIDLAVAAVESNDLRHRRIYLDADLPDDTKTAINARIQVFRRNRERRDAFFQTLGFIGIGLLLFNLLFLSLA